MENREIEVLREQVGCVALLEQDGWRVDIKESTRRAIKYRRNGRIVIVIHDGRGWFDPFSTAKGDVFSLAKHLGADGFADARDRGGLPQNQSRLPPSASVGTIAPNLGLAPRLGAI
jgi:predicted RNA binding protein YcfA (HicA-like mRNA interferase family)